jgi:hypothetical protein
MKKLIEHYKVWAKKGELPDNGLCGSVPDEYIESLLLFKPTKDEFIQLTRLGMSWGYWASGLSPNDSDRHFGLTPLRETIILLICAMHDEI